ncbi:putative ribonuclease H-like domain-containing protein [Tanacetum coccineum]
MVLRAVLMKSGLVSLNIARQVNTAHPKIIMNSARPMTYLSKTAHSTVKKPIHKKTTFKNYNFNQKGNPQMDLQDQGVIDSGCLRHMTGNMSYPTNYEEIDGGYVAFGGNPKGGKIIGKCTIKTGNLDFENVYFLTDESQVLLEVPRKNNMYSVDVKNVIPKGGLTCLFTKATYDESKLWHRRLGHINFKTMNKLVKGNLVRGLPSKLFEIHQTCVACQKGKQHRASCKSKTVSCLVQPLHMLHMDLFGPTFVKSLMKKMYCLVVTDDYSRFSWVFFLATKDETSGILKSFITRVENLIYQRVKVIRCDNGTEFKKKEMNQFCERKGIKREFSVAITPQQNGVAERKNRTLIEAARTMLADSKLPTTFWAEAVNTACYVQNKVLVTKPHNKTPYELFLGRKPALGFMRPFGCPVIILNTIYQLGNFDGKVDEGFFVGYSINRSRPNCLFGIDALTKSINYKPVVAGNQSNGNAGTKACDDADDGSKPSSDDEKKVDEYPRKDSESIDQEKDDNVNNTNNVNAVSQINVGAEALAHEQLGLHFMPVFAPVARIEAIRLFLAYASFKDFVVYQMDVKSAFLYGKIKEEVYVCQPLGFEDPDFPDRVYKVEKALYGLHQAPRAWYETLSTYLLDNGLQRGKIDNNLLIRWDKCDILLVQVYVDDIIFGSTKKSLCGFSIRIFIDVKTVRPPYGIKSLCCKDEDGEEVDLHLLDNYWSHQNWAFGIQKMSPFDLVACMIVLMHGGSLGLKSHNKSVVYSWGCKLIHGSAKKPGYGCNSTTELKVNAARHNLQLLVNVNAVEGVEQFWATVVKTVNGEQQLQALVDEKKIVVTEASIRRDLQLDDDEGFSNANDPFTHPIFQPYHLNLKGNQKSRRSKRMAHIRLGRSARVVSSEEASLGDQEDASKQERKIDDIDKDAEITLVDET